MRQTNIHWFRRDLRLGSNPALGAAAAGGAVVPVFILDPQTMSMGRAALWRLGQGLAVLDSDLRARGSRLILLSGPADQVLDTLVRETGACAVHWQRSHDPASVARDTQIKANLRARGVQAVSHPGFLLAEPWEIATADGKPYKVFTPYHRAFQALDPAGQMSPAPHLHAPAHWPASDSLANWNLGAGVARGGPVLARWACVGAQAAQDRLAAFVSGAAQDYASGRDDLAGPGTSGLSENLAWGEISPAQVLHAARAQGGAGAAAFERQLVWREFAWHLLWHFPRLEHDNWRPEWDAFPWAGDSEAARRWRQAQTGIDLVDAALREMYVTGRMHNRGRMLVASFLTKHLLTDWRVGLRWFADCLTDHDTAANAMGWQWVAGSGPDAAPYFRVFNPDLQATRFDPDGAYRRRWLWGFDGSRTQTAAAWFDCIPRAWGQSPQDQRPLSIVSVAQGRAQALAAHAGFAANIRGLPGDPQLR